MVLLCCEMFGAGWSLVSGHCPMSADLNFWRKQQPPVALIVFEVNINTPHTRSPLKHALPP